MTTRTKTKGLSRAEREWAAVCIEEAAHAIGAVLAGARVTECAAQYDSGIVTIAEPHPRAAEISYFGIYARAVFSYGRTPPLAYLRTAFREATDADREHFGATPELPRHIEKDVEYAMPRIRELALHLFERGSASHEDIEQVLCFGDTRSLSMIQSLFKARCLW